MTKIDDFKKLVINAAEQLAKTQFGELPDQMKSDVQSYLDATIDDIERWTTLLAERRITEKDFSDLVHSSQELAEMVKLTQAGITLTRLERFRSGLIQIVVDSALKTLI